jgi:hypothetical protein
MENSFNNEHIEQIEENIKERDCIISIKLDDNRELIFGDNDMSNQEYGLFKDQTEDESAIYEIEFQIYDKTKNIVILY